MKFRIVETNEKKYDRVPRIETRYIVQVLFEFLFIKFWSTKGYFFGEDYWKPYYFQSYEAAENFLNIFCKKESFKVIKTFECEAF